jgi:hypothetical protein
MSGERLSTATRPLTLQDARLFGRADILKLLQFYSQEQTLPHLRHQMSIRFGLIALARLAFLASQRCAFGAACSDRRLRPALRLILSRGL